MNAQLTSDWYFVVGRFNTLYLFDMASKELRRFEDHEAPNFRTELTDEEIAAIDDVFGFNWDLAQRAMADDQLISHKQYAASYDGLLELARDQDEGTLSTDEMAVELAKQFGQGVQLEWGSVPYEISKDSIPLNFHALEDIHLRIEALNQALLTLTKTQGVNVIRASIFTGYKTFSTLMYWKEAEGGWHWGNWSRFLN